MEVMEASSERVHTLGALVDKLVSEEHPAEEKRLMPDERAILVTQVPFRKGMVSIPWLTEETMTALVTPEGHNGVKRADNLLQTCDIAFATR